MMEKEKLIEYCLAKNGAYLDYPFAGNDYAVVKINNEKNGKYRIFAEIFTLKNEDVLTFATDSELAILLRNQYTVKVVKGYHCPPVQAKYKSSVYMKYFEEDIIKKFVDISYEFAKQKLKISD